MNKCLPVSTVLVAIILCSTSGTAFSRSVLWTRLYDGPTAENDRAYAVSVSGDNVYAAGFSRDSGMDQAVVMAYSREGISLWPPLVHTGISTESEFFDSSVDNSGNLYVVGRESVDGQAESLLVGRITPQGQFGWIRKVEEPGGYTVVNTTYPPRAVYRNGILYMMASLSGHPSDNDAIYVLAASPDNTVQWANALTGPGETGASGANLAVEEDGSGGVVIAVTGVVQDGSGGTGFYVARLNPADGSPLSVPGWEKVFGGAGTGNQGKGIAVTRSAIYVTGILEDPAAAGDFSAAVVALDLSGNETWRDNTVFGSNRTNSNSANFVKVEDNIVYVAGIRDNGTFDAFIRAYSSDNGSLLWDRGMPGGTPRFMVLSDSFVVLGGSITIGAGNLYPCSVSWIDRSTGAMGDNVIFSGYTSGSDMIYAGAVDIAGRVYVTGVVNNSKVPSTGDFFVGAAGSAPSAEGGGGGCAMVSSDGSGVPPGMEWGLILTPVVFLLARRRIRRRFHCNKG